MPIVAALDFHANITPAMIEHASGLLTYRSYPHVDMAQTGQRAHVLLDRLLGGRVLHKGYRQLPFLIPMPWQSTLTEPMRGLVALGESLASEQVFAVDFVPGFPLADIRHSGPSVIAYGSDQVAVEAAVESLTQAVLARRTDFGGRLYAPVTEAVAHAREWGLRDRGWHGDHPRRYPGQSGRRRRRGYDRYPARTAEAKSAAGLRRRVVRCRICRSGNASGNRRRYLCPAGE